MSFDLVSFFLGAFVGLIILDQIYKRAQEHLLKAYEKRKPKSLPAHAVAPYGPLPDKGGAGKLQPRDPYVAAAKDWFTSVYADGLKDVSGTPKVGYVGDPLTLEEFEEDVYTTVANKLNGTPRWFLHVTYKLNGEAGEVSEKLGKFMRDEDWDPFNGAKGLTDAQKKSIALELGDILWYVVVVAREVGYSFAAIMWLNIQKRRDRKKRGTLQGSGDDR